MTITLYPKTPPQLKPLFEILSNYSVEYVVTGSVAALLYGVELEPGDLDITPALDKPNLQKLVTLLNEIEGKPESLGHWETKPDGEKKWVEDETTPEILARWQPDIEDISTLDHLFCTRYGNFDVVPALTGGYEALIKSAIQRNAFGCSIWVAHIDELLAKLTIPRREKDRPRVERLREIQRAQYDKSSRKLILELETGYNLSDSP